MTAPSVLLVNSAAEQADYMEAVAEILRRIQAGHHGADEKPITLCEIAESIDVSLGTISNAANKKGVLNPLYLGRLGRRFGADMLDPYARLVGGRMVPLDAASIRDILPLVGRVNLAIAEARDPESPGGQREILQEKLGYLPHLRLLLRELEATICGIEAERDRVMGRAAA